MGIGDIAKNMVSVRQRSKASFSKTTCWLRLICCTPNGKSAIWLFGRARMGKPMLVVFTIRIVDKIVSLRPISARYMHDKEARKYEEENSKI